MNTTDSHGLQVLGDAAPAATDLNEIAAAALGFPRAEVESAHATALPVPQLNMTTGGLWRVQGTARPAGNGHSPDHAAARPFNAVVKVIQSPLLWPGIGQVPPHMRDELVRKYAWRTEALVYSSGLSAALPDGGRLPAIYAIHELDAQHTAIWMEDVPGTAGPWADATFAAAANWLGRLAGSSTVRESGPPLDASRDAELLRYFVDGVGSMIYIPAIHGEELWRVPAVAAASKPEVIAGLRALADRAYGLVEEMAAMDQLPAHGDAGPQNFMLPPGAVRDFTVIDWGMYRGACPGFDLSQLLSGLVNDGVMRGAELGRLGPACIAAYCEGLASAGTPVAESLVRRGHALSMALFTGLRAVISPRLGEPDSEGLRAHMAGRMEMAEYLLDLLTATD